MRTEEANDTTVRTAEDTEVVRPRRSWPAARKPKDCREVELALVGTRATELEKTEAAAERSVLGSEAGTTDDDMVGPGVPHHGVQARTVKARRRELEETADLVVEPGVIQPTHRTGDDLYLMGGGIPTDLDDDPGQTAPTAASGRRHTSSCGNTGYTRGVAKVMVSLPDDLLRAVDMEADRRGTTRSGYLRELAEETLRRRSAHRAQRMTEIDTMDGPVSGHGGDVTALVKANRPEP